MMPEEGPSVKAIKQADDFAEAIRKRRAANEELHRVLDERVAEEFRTPVTATGAGFPAKHPVQKARRRLFVKVSLRRSAALERLGNTDGAVQAVRAVLRVEPKQPEALEALARLRPLKAPQEAEPAVPVQEAVAKLVEEAGVKPAAPKPAPRPAPKPADEDDDEDEGEDTGVDVKGLTETGAKYIAQQDFKAASEVLAYAVKAGKWSGRPLTRLRCLSNLTLCLQKRRSSADLIHVADGAVKEIRALREKPEFGDVAPDEVVSQVMLNKMECAILSRRGWAHHQLQNFDKGDADARRVKELLPELGEAVKA